MPTCTGSSGSVYETVQFAKLKLLARALEHAQVYEGGRLVISYLLRTDFAEAGAEEPYSEGIIDYLRQVEGAELVGADPRAARRRRADAPGLAALEPATRSTSRRSRAKFGGGGHRQAAGFSSELPIEEIVEFIHREFVAAAGEGDAAARARARRRRRSSTSRPGPSSFALVASSAAARAPAPATPERSIRSRLGCWCCCPGAATKLAPCFVGLDKRYVTDVDLTSTTTTGDPEGEVRSGTSRRPAGARAAARGPPRRGRAADPGRLGGQDRR